MAVNEGQLHYLRRLDASRSNVGLVMQIIFVIIICSIGGLIAVIALPPDRLPFAYSFDDFAGILLVFLVFALVQTVKTFTMANAQRREIRYHCAQQKIALEAAEVAMGSESKSLVGNYE